MWACCPRAAVMTSSRERARMAGSYTGVCRMSSSASVRAVSSAEPTGAYRPGQRRIPAALHIRRQARLVTSRHPNSRLDAQLRPRHVPYERQHPITEVSKDFSTSRSDAGMSAPASERRDRATRFASTPATTTKPDAILIHWSALLRPLRTRKDDDAKSGRRNDDRPDQPESHRHIVDYLASAEPARASRPRPGHPSAGMTTPGQVRDAPAQAGSTLARRVAQAGVID